MYVTVDGQDAQKKALGVLELELWAVLSYPFWVLGTELTSSKSIISFCC